MCPAGATYTSQGTALGTDSMGFHTWMIVFLDFRIRENDGMRSPNAFKPIPLRWVGH
ncbi:MAG: hypothetical protein NTZ30_09180 [Planctomycetota bacterium]|nr:hypothetical protein [Planctomycetota bacterium]